MSAFVPRRVKLEVQRYLECGNVRYGFVEVTCEGCSDSRLVAFSCKGRGWCPSCTTRRTIETGAHLEAVLPRVAHRQWTLSLPFSVRFAVVKQPALLKKLEVRLVRAVWRWQRATARRLGVRKRLRGGAVCFWQWFGSSLQLTPHLHLLVLCCSRKVAHVCSAEVGRAKITVADVVLESRGGAEKHEPPDRSIAVEGMSCGRRGRPASAGQLT